MPVCISTSWSARLPPVLFEVFFRARIKRNHPSSQRDISAQLQLRLIDCITCRLQCPQNSKWCKNTKKKNCFQFNPFGCFNAKNLWLSCRMFYLGYPKWLLHCSHSGRGLFAGQRCDKMKRNGGFHMKVVLSSSQTVAKEVKSSRNKVICSLISITLQSLAQWHLFHCYHISKAFPHHH